MTTQTGGGVYNYLRGNVPGPFTCISGLGPNPNYASRNSQLPTDFTIIRDHYIWLKQPSEANPLALRFLSNRNMTNVFKRIHYEVNRITGQKVFFDLETQNDDLSLEIAHFAKNNDSMGPWVKRSIEILNCNIVRKIVARVVFNLRQRSMVERDRDKKNMYYKVARPLYPKFDSTKRESIPTCAYTLSHPITKNNARLREFELTASGMYRKTKIPLTRSIMHA